MSVFVKEEGILRVMAFDPSTTNLGISFIDINVKKSEKFKLIYCNTIFGEKVCYDIPAQFDDRAATGVLARSYALSRASRELIKIYEPDTAICEDNFLGVSAGTFKQLIQAVSLLREAVNSFGLNLHMSYVLPNLAKAIVEASFKGTTKEDVQAGLRKYRNLETIGIDLDKVDEHSADSAVVGLYRAEQIAKDYGVWNG